MARHRKRRSRGRARNGALKLMFTSRVRRNALLTGMAVAFISTGWKWGKVGEAYGQLLASKVKGVFS